MEELEKEIIAVKERCDNIEKAYAEECLVLSQQKGFDIYKPKWQRKLDKLAEKYAEYLVPERLKHKELLNEYEDKLEEKRKSQYRDA